MTALTSKKPKNTYKDLLQVSNSNAGIDGTRRAVEDGEGTASKLLLSSAAQEMTGPLYMTGASIFGAEGAAVASAAAPNIWATDGDTIHITGTTTITSFAAAPQVGAWKRLIFDDAVLLTHGANLNLNAGGANITTATDDVAFVYADTTTQFDVFVFKKSGQANVSSSVAAITSGTITGITDLAVADGGTGSSTAAAAKVALGLETIPQNSQSAAYTTVLADAGKHILHPASDNNARTFTIDSNANVAYVIGTTIVFVNQINTLTIAITSDTMTLQPDGTTGSITLTANQEAKALKITATSWVIKKTAAVATATVAGMVPVPPNNTTTFLRGDATFAAPTAGAYSFVSTSTISNQATVDVQSLASGYDYIFQLSGLITATDDVALFLRIEESGAFQAGAGAYAWRIQADGGTRAVLSDTEIELSNVAGGTAALSNAANETCSLQVTVPNVGATVRKKIYAEGVLSSSGTAEDCSPVQGGGNYIANTNAITGVRFLASSGNLTSGTLDVYRRQRS